MQRQDETDFILSKKVGTYFMRKISVGHSLRESDSHFQNPRNSEDYPRSAFGSVEYRTSHGTYQSIGTLIGRNLIVTVTPQFVVQFPHEEYQKKVFDYLKLKNNYKVTKKIQQHKGRQEINLGQLDKSNIMKRFRMIKSSSIIQRQNEFQNYYNSQKYNTIQKNLLKSSISEQQFAAQTQLFDHYMSTIPNDEISFLTFDNHCIPSERIMYSHISTSLPTGQYHKKQLISNQLIFIQLSQSLMDQYYGCLGLCFNRGKSESWDIQHINHLLPYTQELQTSNYTGRPLIRSNKSKFYVVGLNSNKKDILFNNQEYSLMQAACLTLNYQISRWPNQQIGVKLSEKNVFNDQFSDLTVINFKTASSFPHPINFDLMSNPYLWSNIRQLIFDDNKVTDSLIKKLTRIHLLKLHYCSISFANFSNQHSVHFMKGYWPNLRYLCLNNNKICKQGIQYLRKGDWPYIQTVNLNNNHIYPNQFISIYFGPRN